MAFNKAFGILLFSIISFQLSFGSEKDSIPISLPDTILFDELVVVGSRFPEKIINSLTSISILNSPLLRANSKTSMADAFETTCGVFMQKTNNGGGSPFIRGLTGYQTLILIDGIRLNNATFRSGPNQYLNTIDPLSVDRIEVLRGGGSVQYGTDAIGGTIYILTKQPEFTAEGKAFHGLLYGKMVSANMEQSGRAELQVSAKRISIAGGLSLKNYGNIVAGKGLGTLNYTAYNENDADLKISLKLSEKNLLTLAWQQVNQKDVPLYHKLIDKSHTIYSFDPQKRDLYYLKLKSKSDNSLFSEITTTASVQRSLEIREKQKTLSPLFTKETDVVTSYGFTMENVSDLYPFWKMITGIEYYYDFVESNSTRTDFNTGSVENLRGLYPDQSSVASTSAFALNRFSYERIELEAGIRYNAFILNLKDELFGNTNITPSALVGNIGLSFRISKNTRIVASANSAFRAPNINDVSSFGIADFRYEVPNFNLKPEKSINTEIGIKTNSRNSYVAVYAFRNSLRDLISNVKTSYNNQDSIDGIKVYHRENSDQALIRGLEAEFRAGITRYLSINGHVIYTHGQNISANEPMRRIPPLYAGVGVSSNPWKKGTITLDLQAAGAQKRLSGGDKDDNRIPVGGSPAWNILNFKIYQSWKSFNFHAGIGNVFDSAYRTHGSGVDGMGRNFWVSAAYRF